MKPVQLKKSYFKIELYLFGRRVATFLRMWNILDSIMKDVGWIVGHYSMKQRGLELPADCHLYWSEQNELVDIKVGDIKRYTVDGPVPLAESMLVKYLRSGDEEVIRSYYRHLGKIGGLSPAAVEGSVKQSRKLFDSIRDVDYDPSICCIVVNENNEIIDGYHRSSAILVKYGEDHKVRVLRLLQDLRQKGK